MKKSQILAGWIMAFMVAVTICNSTYAGACDPASEAGNTRRIDGPANIREQPNDQSKILASLPNRSSVVIVSFAEKQNRGKTQIWYYVSWTQSGKTFEGWTHEQNIVCD